MEITASYSFAASRDRVWTMMLDPGAIASLEPVSTSRMRSFR